MGACQIFIDLSCFPRKMKRMRLNRPVKWMDKTTGPRPTNAAAVFAQAGPVSAVKSSNKAGQREISIDVTTVLMQCNTGSLRLAIS